MNESSNVCSKSYMVYCHFSFRRRKTEPGFGYFTAVFSYDMACKKVACRFTHKKRLWEDQQFVSAVQSYEFALSCIAEVQGQMLEQNVNQVMLVTGNGALANWIENPKKNRNYRQYMERAVADYKSGARRAIVVGIGLCESVDSEKAYKYCCEERLTKKYEEPAVLRKSGGNLLDIGKLGGEAKTALDIADEIKAETEIIIEE